MGWCNPANAPDGEARGGLGYGRGRGGRGGGWRHRRFWATEPNDPSATPAPDDRELGALREQVARIEQAVGALLARLEKKETP